MDKEPAEKDSRGQEPYLNTFEEENYIVWMSEHGWGLCSKNGKPTAITS